MDNLETPYDDEAEFIECKVCEKSIRGETLYKIHLTTPGHIKKEDVVVAAGLAVRQHTVPVFEDIIQYLDYMKLDEPIIGLSYLDGLPCNDPQAGPRYTCRLCHQTANLPEMVRHVIGRKHRQKYMEQKRPDLVTWDKQSIITQGGKIIRARAEIIERQDGRGRPQMIAKKEMEGKLNSTVPPRQKQNIARNTSQSLTHQDVLSHLPHLMASQDEYSYQDRCPPGHPNAPPFHQKGPYMLNRDRPIHRWEDTHHNDAEDLRRADYREGGMYRQDNMDRNYHGKYDDEYVEDPQRRATYEPDCIPRYDSRADLPRGQAQHVENYSEETPPYRRLYPEKDQLKEFYSEEVRRRQAHSAGYKSSQPVFPDDNKQRWESGSFNNMIRAGRQGLSEPEAKRRSFPTSVESDRPCDHLFSTVRDLCREMREPHQEDAVVHPGPSRTEPPNSHRQVAVTRSIFDIPEPFRRFLKGAANDEGHGKRKRKSRFSDATAEEVKMTKEMFSDKYGPPSSKFGGRPSPVSAPPTPEMHGVQHSDLFTKSLGTHQTESYQSQDSDSGVFDMLKNIEIENAEEANFLKNKLCDLLKEFKAKKSVKAGQNNPSRAVSSRDYNNLKPDTEQPPGHQYEKILREDSDLRRLEDLYYEEDYGGRGWKLKGPPEEDHQGYHHSLHEEPRNQNSRGGCYEDEMSLAPHASHPDKAGGCPDRFQEQLHFQDLRHAAENFWGSQSSAPMVHMDRGLRMDRGTRYSRNLDKITSTLLELVARK